MIGPMAFNDFHITSMVETGHVGCIVSNTLGTNVSLAPRTIRWLVFNQVSWSCPMAYYSYCLMLKLEYNEMAIKWSEAHHTAPCVELRFETLNIICKHMNIRIPDFIMGKLNDLDVMCMWEAAYLAADLWVNTFPELKEDLMNMDGYIGAYGDFGSPDMNISPRSIGVWGSALMRIRKKLLENRQ